MANETILRSGFIAKAASEVEGTLGAEALAVINTSGVTQFTLPTADGTAGYAMTTNGSGTLSWSAIPSISGLLSDITSESIHDLSDVEGTTGLADGDVLQWNNSNSQWEHVAATSIGVTTLAALSDTSISTPSAGAFLRYDQGNSEWIDDELAVGDITASMVTQHEGDLTITESQISDLGTYQATSEKGQANGYASLDGSGLVPSSQLPSYVDDVEEYANESSFPATGETGKLYVDLSDNSVHRWSGSAYVNITDYSTPGHTHVASDITDFSTAADARIAAASIDDLSDVSLGGDTTEDKVLAFNNSGVLVPTSVADLSTSDSVSTLTDVTLSALGAGEILYSTGASAWANRTPAEAGLALATDIANMVETTDNISVLADVTGIGNDGDILVNSGGSMTGVASISHDSITNFDAEVNALIGAATLADLASGSITDLDEVAAVGTNGQILVSNGTNLIATDFTDWSEDSTTLASDGATSLFALSTVGSYAAVTVHYSLSDGTNMRMGTLMAITDGSTVELTDISTNQIGSDAEEPVFSATTTGSNIDIKVTDGNGYTVKSTYRLING